MKTAMKTKDEIRAMYAALLATVGKVDRGKASLDASRKDLEENNRSFVVLFRDQDGKKTKAAVKEAMRLYCQTEAGTKWPKDGNGKPVGYQKAMKAKCKDAAVYNAFAKHCDTCLNDDASYITKEQRDAEKAGKRITAAAAADKTRQIQETLHSEELKNAAGNVPLDTLLEILKEKYKAIVEEKENGFITVTVNRNNL